MWFLIMVNNIDSYHIVSKLLSEVLDGHPNYDMLIHKPALYIYIPRSSFSDAKLNGIRAGENNTIAAYFTRVPESISKYSEFLRNNLPVRIQCQKLERIKDQQIRLYPVNIETDKKTFTADDISEISKKNNFFFDYFKNVDDLSKMPHINIWVETGILPSFAVKFLIKKAE